MALGNSSLGRDILKRHLFFLARGAKPLAHRRNFRLDQLLVHQFAFSIAWDILFEGCAASVNRR
jgi:hypothetical protein